MPRTAALLTAAGLLTAGLAVAVPAHAARTVPTTGTAPTAATTSHGAPALELTGQEVRWVRTTSATAYLRRAQQVAHAAR